MARLGSRYRYGICCCLLGAVALAGCTSSSATASPTPSSPATSSAEASSPAGSSSAASSPATSRSAAIRVVAAPTGAAVRLTKGQQLQVVLPATSSGSGQTTTYGLLPAGSTALVATPGTPGLFTAGAAGVVKVQVTQAPVCVAGQACVAHIAVVGSITVTVAS